MSQIGVAVLGSTGTVGCSTLEVLGLHPERFRVCALAARSNVESLLAQCRRFEPDWAGMESHSAAQELAQRLRACGSRTRVVAGAADIAELPTQPEVQYVMAAISGAAGLASSLAAAAAGKRLLLANKESAVMAGPLLIAAVRASGAELVPIDSEHNAIFQCLPNGFQAGMRPSGVRRLLLTASGGPFLTWSAEAIERATPAQACAHPRWHMGRKISVDSATLMNKGLEMIEASVLFGMPAGDIEVLVHPQSVIHSLVEYADGSVLAQLGNPDMRTAIAHALAWPERVEAGVSPLDLAASAPLQFEQPDLATFRCLALAFQALRAGGDAPAILNAANEVAVEAFLAGALPFLSIADVVESVLTELPAQVVVDIQTLGERDRAAREAARRVLRNAC